MISLFVATLLAARLGPMGPDAPAREPQLAAGGSMIGLTFGAGTNIYFSASRDNGRTFSAPVKVVEGGILPLNRHRGPRIALSANTIVISAVLGKTPSHEQHAHGLPADGDLLAWRSTDGGKTWSKGIAINDVPSAPTEGLHSLAGDGRGVLFAAWLDKRSGKGTQLYGARSTDGGATWSKNILVYQSPEGTICECCHPSVGVAPGGQVTVMWRNWLAGARDMYFSQSAGLAFSDPEKLGLGRWQLNACPMDGGGLVVSAEKIITAWRRGDSVYLAEPGKPEMQIGSGKDVALAISGNRPFAIWSNGRNIEFWHEGRVEPLAENGAFPAIASSPDGSLLAAWEDNGVIVIKRLPVPTGGR